MQPKKTKRILYILFCIALIVFAGCIVRPEYLAEANKIPHKPEPEKVKVTATPSPTTEPIYTSEPTAVPTSKEEDKESEKIRDAEQENVEVDWVGYEYNLLTSSQKEIYAQFDTHLSKYETTFTVYCNDMEDIKTAYQALVKDRPEFFYLRGYNKRYYEGSTEIEISMFYEDGTTVEQVKSEIKKVDSVVDEVFAQMKNNLTDYEKIVYFYTWIVEHVKYEAGVHDQTIVGVFLENKAVCNGYAESFQYLCNKSGIVCTTASGYGKNDLHAWNLIKLNDQYYWVDVTWGDHTDGAEDELQGQYNDYAFLCVDDEFLFQSHTLDEEESYPACTDRTMNYYYITGGFFERYDRNEIFTYLQDMLGSTANAKAQLMFEYHEDYLKMLEEGTDMIHAALESNPNYQRAYTIHSWHTDSGNYIFYIID